MEKVLVIGSNSFSGSHFIDFLLENSAYKLIGISRSAEKKALYLPYKQRNLARFQFHQLDLNRHLTRIIELMNQERPAYVINFASQSMVGPSWDNPNHWYKTNVLSTVYLIQNLKGKDYLKKYVHVSTPEVYGSCRGRVKEEAPFNPSTPYAASRAATDTFINLLVKQFNFPAVFTRAANVYGPGQQLFKIIPRSIVYMKLGKKIPLHGGGEAQRSFIYIKDVCAATRLIMEKAEPGEVYHLSTKDLYSIKELVEKIAAKLGKNFAEVTDTIETRRGLDAAYILDSGKAYRNFNWQSRISLEEGLKETISWVEKNWETITKEPLDYIHQE